MITSRIQIEDGPVLDTYKAYGLIYMSADNRTEAPIKKRETTSYAEYAGEHTDPRTVQDAFDYKATFLIETPNNDASNANAKIAEFNKRLYAKGSGGIRIYKELTLYDDYKRVKIVGLPEPIAEPKELYRRQDGSEMDCVEVELVIHVSNPEKCNFALGAMPIMLSITTDGSQIFVQTSSPLNEKQRVVVMERGRASSHYLSGQFRYHQKSALRWHVPDGSCCYYLNNNNAIIYSDSEKDVPLSDRYGWWTKVTADGGHTIACVRKASNSTFCIPYETGRSAKITFGVAVYEYGDFDKTKKRISNVCYFQSNVKVINGNDEDSGMEQWLST